MHDLAFDYGDCAVYENREAMNLPSTTTLLKGLALQLSPFPALRRVKRFVHDVACDNAKLREAELKREVDL